MRHEDRRREAGKVLMDIAKYLLTVGLLGAFIADKLTLPLAITIVVIAFISFIVGFYIIPPKTEGGK